ncbi:unnamed protein product [Darwinula stevensoni]|uniref:Endothelin-converting enzyme 1 n=1 Tax=Darwinula stevensoni TaxID=69355 RepID=A0A7R9A2P9_9CRUS|nr:unnamed protein product [Darwinula stevensoni]CAG0890144.1 unnamed protein product [Darwinula stevensoni]
MDRKVVAVFAGLLALLFAAFAAVFVLYLQERLNDETPTAHRTSDCSRPSCIHAAHRILSTLDPTVDPCTDFFLFACGGWLREHPLPPDRLFFSRHLDGVREDVDQELLDLLKPESRVRGDFPPFQKLREFHQMCLSAGDIKHDEQIAHTLLRILNEAGGFRGPEGWDDSGFDLTQHLGGLLKRHSGSFLDVTVDVDIRNATRFALHVVPPNQKAVISSHSRAETQEVIENQQTNPDVQALFRLALDDATGHEEQGQGPKKVKKRPRSLNSTVLHNFLQESVTAMQASEVLEVLEILGLYVPSEGPAPLEPRPPFPRPGPGPGKTNLSSLLASARDDFHRALVLLNAVKQASPSEKEQKMGARELETFQHILTVSQLSHRHPFIDWKRLLAMLLGREADPGEEVFVVAPDYLDKLADILDQADNRTIHNALTMGFLRDTLMELVAFPPHGDKDRFCLEATKMTLSVPLASLFLYAQKAGDLREIRRKVKELWDSVKSTYMDALGSNPSLDADVKDFHLSRVQGIAEFFVTADFFFEDPVIAAFADSFSMNRTNFLESVSESYRDQRREYYALLNNTPNAIQTAWAFRTPPYVVNAFYGLDFNNIVLPFAFLKKPNFFTDAPHYMLFGSMGHTLAHEVTHMFDRRGFASSCISHIFRHHFGLPAPQAQNHSPIRVDSAVKADISARCTGNKLLSSGKRVNTWPKKTREYFEGVDFCLASSYQELFADFYLMVANDSFIAQYDAKFAALENLADVMGMRVALKAYQNWQKSHPLEPGLPGVPYSNEQILLIRNAQANCGHLDGAGYALVLEVDEHTPHPQRVNGQMRLLEEFADAFKCSPRSPMNPHPKCPLL